MGTPTTNVIPLVDTSAMLKKIQEDQKINDKKLSNSEFLNDIMEFAPVGPIAQIFVIEAIRYYAEQVKSGPKPTESGNGIINPIAWHDTAEYLYDRFEAKYGNGSKDQQPEDSNKAS